MSSNPIIWSPSLERMQSSAMFDFMRERGFDDYDSLYRWSVEDLESFWRCVAGYCDVRFDRQADTILTRPNSIMGAGWFVGAELNYAANLLQHDGEQAALVFTGEDGSRRELSRRQLRKEVAAVAAGLRSAGVVKGDRVAGYLPNCPEAIIGMLATASIGAVWSSCSPDFGSNGIIDHPAQGTVCV